MTSKVFVDTNILLYTADHKDKSKQERCQDLLRSFVGQDIRPVISTQILQEFYVVATRKLRMEELTVKSSVVQFYARYEVVTVTPSLINAGIDCSILNRISFWDALIIVAAEAAHCKTIYTEDLNHGQVIGSSDAQGGTIKNRPVTPADLAATIYQHMEVPLDSTYLDTSGRPLYVVEASGNPIGELF